MRGLAPEPDTNLMPVRLAPSARWTQSSCAGSWSWCFPTPIAFAQLISGAWGDLNGPGEIITRYLYLEGPQARRLLQKPQGNLPLCAVVGFATTKQQEHAGRPGGMTNEPPWQAQSWMSVDWDTRPWRTKRYLFPSVGSIV